MPGNLRYFVDSDPIEPCDLRPRHPVARWTSAEAFLGGDEARLARARAAIVAAMGAAALVDAADIAGLFNAIDRLADATGAPLEEAHPASRFRWVAGSG
jgi:hypothetical protein